ncbi:MAG TPA: site-2 protease family protein, partial [bacterium]|nr:site-2 protease family protein [bacterium]
QAKVAAAGPLANLILAVAAAMAAKYLAGGITTAWGAMLVSIVLINLVLMIFNLLPIPPLDGSKIIATFLPNRLRYAYLATEQWGFFVLIAIMLAWPNLLYYPVAWMLNLLI